MISWILPLLLAWPAHAGDRLDLDAPTSRDDIIEAAVTVIEQQFDGQVDREQLYRAAVAGMAEHLDDVLGAPGNRLLTRQEHGDILAWERGERSGIGVEFSIVSSQGLLLTDIYADSPAARARLVSGDLIVAMDDHPLTGLSSAAIHDITQRSASTKVVLDVRRKGGTLRRMTLDRQSYRVGSVALVGDTKYPVVRVAFFGEGAAQDLALVLAGLDGDGAVALDLRDCPGGLLDEVVAAADLFLAPGSVVTHRVASDGTAEPIVVSGERVWKGSVVLLANRGTVGPAEAFVAALQDHRVAMVVGTPTAGLSTIPSYHPVGTDLVLQLAGASMQGPSGRVWSGSGLAPDVLVEPMGMSLPAHPGEAPLDLQRDAALRLMSGGR